MKRQPDAEFAAFIGIDWADANTMFCVQPASGPELGVATFNERGSMRVQVIYYIVT